MTVDEVRRRRLLPYSVSQEMLNPHLHTEENSSWVAELIEGEQRKHIRVEIQNLFSKYDSLPALNSLTHVTLSVVVLDPERAISISIAEHISSARRLFHLADPVDQSRWLFNHTMHLVGPEPWLHARAIVTRGPCKNEIRNELLYHDPVGLLWETVADVNKRAVKGAEIFLHVIGDFAADFDDLEAAVQFFNDLEDNEISYFDIRSAPLKLVY